MDKLTIFVAMILVGVLRGLLQRRHVRAELEDRMAKAKSRPVVRKLSGRLQTETDVEPRLDFSENLKRQDAKETSGDVCSKRSDSSAEFQA